MTLEEVEKAALALGEEPRRQAWLRCVANRHDLDATDGMSRPLMFCRRCLTLFATSGRPINEPTPFKEPSP